MPEQAAERQKLINEVLGHGAGSPAVLATRIDLGSGAGPSV
jgi:hypothetical protein